MQGVILVFLLKQFFRIHLITALLLFASYSSAITMGINDMKNLENGQVIQKIIKGQSLKSSKTINGSESKILIKAPAEKVWKVLNEKENLPVIVRQIKEAKILADWGNHQKVRASVKICRLLPTFDYVLDFDQSEKYKRMKFKKTEGCFEELFGYFEFIPHGESTILAYKIYSDPGFYIPEFITNGLKSDAEDIMRTIKKEAEK